MNATEQLGLILAGQQDKFDVGAMFNAAVTQTASAIINTQPNETTTDKLINSYQSTVVSDMSSSILLGQPPTPTGLAAHLAGSALGTLVTAPREIAWQRQKQQEMYQKAQQAPAGEGSVSEEHKSYGMKPQPKPKKPSFFGPGIPEHGIEDMDLGFHELTVDDAFNGYQLALRFSKSDTTKAQRWQQEVAPTKSNWQTQLKSGFWQGVDKLVEAGLAIDKALYELSMSSPKQKTVVLGEVLTTAYGSELAEFGIMGLNGLGLFSKGMGSVVKNTALREKIMANIAKSKEGRRASNFEIHVLIEKVPKLDVSTGLDEAVFWSGRGNRELTESYALLTDKFTL